MKKILTYPWLLLVANFALASEPANLAIVKQALVRYHDSGAYHEDIDRIISDATRYLNERLAHPNGKKPAIVLDIDETSLSNYPNMVKLNFGGTREDMQRAEKNGEDPVISPTLKFYQEAIAHHVAIFFITGRDPSERNATISNLKKAGFTTWDRLFFKPAPLKNVPVAFYKSSIRKQLTHLGYDIIVNIGDQKSDLAGGYADRGYKLPNPYYLIS